MRYGVRRYIRRAPSRYIRIIGTGRSRGVVRRVRVPVRVRRRSRTVRRTRRS